MLSTYYVSKYNYSINKNYKLKSMSIVILAKLPYLKGAEKDGDDIKIKIFDNVRGGKTL